MFMHVLKASAKIRVTRPCSFILAELYRENSSFYDSFKRFNGIERFKMRKYFLYFRSRATSRFLVNGSDVLSDAPEGSIRKFHVLRNISEPVMN